MALAVTAEKSLLAVSTLFYLALFSTLFHKQALLSSQNEGVHDVKRCCFSVNVSFSFYLSTALIVHYIAQTDTKDKHRDEVQLL